MGAGFADGRLHGRHAGGRCRLRQPVPSLKDCANGDAAWRLRSRDASLLSEPGLFGHWCQGAGVRELARRIGRGASTVFRSLTRNAATRGDRLEDRASLAQWKAELLARRSTPSKLLTAPRLHDYVLDRLEGRVRDAHGRDLSGPLPAPFIGRSHRLTPRSCAIFKRIPLGHLV